jgi:hypothetical protein
MIFYSRKKVILFLNDLSFYDWAVVLLLRNSIENGQVFKSFRQLCFFPFFVPAKGLGHEIHDAGGYLLSGLQKFQ